MNNIEAIAAEVQQMLQGAEGGHDWWHIVRVRNTALAIGKQEQANLVVVELAALLHDIADAKFNDGNESTGIKKVEALLEKHGVVKQTHEHVIEIISNISFAGGNYAATHRSKELDVVQDADRLDALGAIGIARAFSYGGHKKREFFNPSILPRINMTKEEYRASNAPTINHFYEKLLLLKERMNTQSGKLMAEQRHEFLVQFLMQFYKEWEGNAEDAVELHKKMLSAK